ncbi:MAG: hypothetical protein H0W78_15565 [Planctomycetes bacterium]|nr:hypothetical protein [Planctomycetota bacterium]
MLSTERLELALDIHGRSYRLLKWVSDAIGKGFIPVTRAHEYANETVATRDWIEGNFDSLPPAIRPAREQLVTFPNFFSTYLMSSFDFTASPGMRAESKNSSFCTCCSRLVNAPHLRAKTLNKCDKRRAEDLMALRARALATEHGIALEESRATELVAGDLRRDLAYSTYGHWLVQRLDGHSDGPAILALWRNFAWKKTGSPIPDFTLSLQDFIDAETRILAALNMTKESP